MMYWIYVIRNPEGKIYIGQTGNLVKRLADHNLGKTRYTTYIGGPWELIYKEPYETRSLAMKREKELKTGKGREFLKQHIPG